ncbi:DUF4388 domain-containing protein [Paraliomyxa miuraensis]|uniref:DUF4388 domain-containing protein n=1 Tax=Paraliomyxa miuraensis TaxID=376150 RepID=UPI00224E1BA4|nr:DUF4388 domain-containing protein [Paraliomyxa miuraensis]MCX4243318.1 DUF4388 domain-containing protein [Paraliomyxa miuraensis]
MATAPVSNEPSVGFPPKGSLKKVPFPRLIREVARRKLDGSLYLLSGQTKKVVFFSKGQPVFVRSNVLSECLGQILAQEGLITQEQCDQTLEAIRRTGKKQGELLVEMGILSEGNLRYGLEAQLRAKLFEIFSWDDGRYQFKNEAPDQQFGITFKASAEGVIVEAIQDQYTEDRASDVLEPVSSKFPVAAPSGAYDELPLLPEERFFLTCLDGSRSIAELMDDPGKPPVPTPKALLCGLLAAGVIKLVDVAQARRTWPPAPSMAPTGGTDAELRPSFEAQALITEYEDTPLPGEMPRSPDLLGDHEDGFEGVGEDSAVVRLSGVMRAPELPEELVAAEPASIEETFDDDQLELAEEGDLEFDLEPEPNEAPNEPESEPESEPRSTPTLPPMLAAPATPALATTFDEPEPAALDDDAALDDMFLGESEEPPGLDFDNEPPTSVDGPVAAAAGVPAVVEPTSTLPTPEPEPVVPPMVAAPQAVPRTDSPSPPAPVEPTPLPVSPTPSPVSPVAPVTPVAPPVVTSAPAAAAAVQPEEDLLDLAPDDDLLMLDESVEAAAADLIGSVPAKPPAPVSPVADLDPGSLDPGGLDPSDLDPGDLDPGDLDPGDFDPDGFESEAIDDELELEEVDDLELDELDDELDAAEPEPEPEPVAAPVQPAAVAAPSDDLLDLDDLDDIDLGGDDPVAPAAVAAPMVVEDEPSDIVGDDEDMMGALRFGDGQAAIAEGRWDDAIGALEEAYESGFDVAELHAMLAYARFQASGGDEQTAQHAFELLDYAQQMDPSLDLVHAYRGAILRDQGDIPQAREALDRALELNPYCELAMEILDAIGG